ncbi:Uncharacterised protein [Vibrio cholerae]|nr:Uncharacterised protein [Vibrio cholerae]
MVSKCNTRLACAYKIRSLTSFSNEGRRTAVVFASWRDGRMVIG